MMEALAVQSMILVQEDNMPPAPDSLEATGLSEAFVANLIIKHLYRYGVLSGLEVANKIALPFHIVDDVLNEIVLRTQAEKRGGQGLGNANDRFALTDTGRAYARELFELDTYVGPAPVPLDQYWQYVRDHSLGKIPVNERLLRDAWNGFIVDDALFAQIGPAIRSGKSCFLYGPPGTGKTTMAKKIAHFLDQCGGKVAIPHAVIVGGSMIRVYDPVHHGKSAQEEQNDSLSILFDNKGDRRWVLCNRPVVIVGGELMLDMLDLRYNATTRYYEAPLQMKANGGILIIDDFGRQMVQPRDLLNRWIVPLEERVDYLTLHTGKKFSIPFEQLVVFATNLNPNDLVDEAFLRRIRYKVYIGEPSVEAFKQIFNSECRKKKIEIEGSVVDRIIRKYYHAKNRPLRACDARDITDQLMDYCAFKDLPLQVPSELLEGIASTYLTELNQNNGKKAVLDDMYDDQMQDYHRSMPAK